MSPRTYPTAELAFRRVDAIKIKLGVWPGVRRTEGGYELAYDPEREGEHTGRRP